MHDPQTRLTVVALAGGSLEADFRSAGYEVTNKAYLPIGGELMLERVLRALRGAQAVKEIRCVTQRAALASAPQAEALCDRAMEPGSDLISSLLAGASGLPDDERVLVCSTDLPLLTPQAVDGFAAVAARTPCDLGYGFVERSLHDRSYAGVRHTWVRLREGTFCGSGVSVLRAGAIRQVQDVLRRFSDARKSPAKMAALLSPGFIFRFLTGRLRIAQLEAQASSITRVVCRGIVAPFPEVAVNVDRLEDLRMIERYISAA